VRVLVGVKLTVYKLVEVPDHVWERQYAEQSDVEYDATNDVLNDSIASQMPELGTGYDTWEFEDEWYEPVNLTAERA
jgi:hypothetical protein